MILKSPDRLVIEIPPKLKQKFKRHCIQKDTDMSKLLRSMIREEISSASTSK